MECSLTSRRTVLGLIGASILYPGIGRASGIDTAGGTAFGTTWAVAAPRGTLPPRLASEIDALFGGIDRQMSPWRDDSEISKFNQTPAGVFRAGADLIGVTRASLAIARASDGAFDPTVGPLVARWGFGPVAGAETPDWRSISVSPNGIAKARAALTLDLCGIAKGYALDSAIELMRGRGVEQGLLDLGGELRALGRHPSGRPWRVAVKPLSGREDAPAIINLEAGQAVATSGLAAQGYQLGDRTWGHIIDPRTKSPARNALSSVTVLSSDAMTADAWATALFSAGEDRGPELARANDIAALFVIDHGGQARTIDTGAIAEAIL